MVTLDPPDSLPPARSLDLRTLAHDIGAVAFQVERDLDEGDERTALARARALRELMERLPR